MIGLGQRGLRKKRWEERRTVKEVDEENDGMRGREMEEGKKGKGRGEREEEEGDKEQEEEETEEEEEEKDEVKM